METRGVVFLVVLLASSVLALPKRENAALGQKAEEQGSLLPLGIKQRHVSAQADMTPWRVCFYTNWAQYRPIAGKFFPEDIDVTLCSHLNYAFSNMGDNKLIPYEPNDYEMYVRFNNLKTQYPEQNLKTFLAVGGWTFGTTNMTLMLGSQENRTEFINDAIRVLRLYDFDGLELDFEYPGNRGSPPEDKQRFTLLCQEAQAAFLAEDPVNPLMLTISVAAGLDVIDSAYEIQPVSEAVNMIHLMAYDYFVWNSSGCIGAEPHSPLYQRPNMFPQDLLKNVNKSAQYWIAGGCPPHKMTIGLAGFGRGYTLVTPLDTSLGAPTSGLSNAGEYTRDDGFMSYYEVCAFVVPEATVERSPAHRVPYAHKGDQWVSYEDAISLVEKVDYLMEHGFAGFMFWDLDFDDFKGLFCSNGTYPLLKAVNNAMKDYVVPLPAELPPPDENYCLGKANGYYQDPATCSRYYRCTDGATESFTCAEGTIYDPAIVGCRDPASMDPTWVCDNCPAYCPTAA